MKKSVLGEAIVEIRLSLDYRTLRLGNKLSSKLCLLELLGASMRAFMWSDTSGSRCPI